MPSGKKGPSKIKKPNLTSNACKHYYEELLLDGIRKTKTDEEETETVMRRYIDSMVDDARKQKSIPLLKFYIIHVNHFYNRQLEEEDETVYYPAEISIAECTLKDGVIRVYNEIINKEIDVGYFSSTKELIDSTHGIEPNIEGGKQDYSEIFAQIQEFLAPALDEDKLFPPLYTRSTDETVFKSVQSALMQFAITCGYQYNYFKLYSLEHLFASIHNAINENERYQLDFTSFKVKLTRDPYSHQASLACNFHSILQKGQNFCSEAIIKRWYFVLCKECIESLNLRSIPGVHMPEKTVRNFLGINPSNSSSSSSLPSVNSETGVNQEYRIKVSERTYAEEQRRRRESAMIPFTIIDYSKLNSENPQENQNFISRINERTFSNEQQQQQQPREPASLPFTTDYRKTNYEPEQTEFQKRNHWKDSNSGPERNNRRRYYRKNHGNNGNYTNHGNHGNYSNHVNHGNHENYNYMHNF